MKCIRGVIFSVYEIEIMKSFNKDLILIQCVLYIVPPVLYNESLSFVEGFHQVD